ncbi:LysR family transcriptional regulator [Salinisphaera hydrothermalis]|uniref:LysR family transcriptional regulator n=1 Tax=Salinisphaera hydrothermalis TaxID=563188 RepID=UPI0033415875
MAVQASLSQWRHFVWVADLKSFHAAAERAFRTQPAISLSIRQLEARLGEALFEANRKAVRLTAFGELCLPRVRDLLEFHDRTLAEIERLARRDSGRVTLAAVPSAAARLLPGIIERFAARYPSIELSLIDDTARDVQHRVMRRQVDFAFTSVWETDSRLVFRPLTSDRMGVVCRNDHALANHEGPITWDALRGQRLIDNGTTRLLSDTPGAAVVAESAHFFVSNMISLTAMVEAGLGATVLPQLAQPVGHSGLCFVSVEEPVVERRLGLMSLDGQALSPAARALYDVIAEAFDERDNDIDSSGTGDATNG